MTHSPVAKLTGARLSFHFFVLPSSPTRHVSGLPSSSLPPSRWFRLPSCCFFLVPLPPPRRRRPSVRFSDIRRMVLSTSFVPLTDITRPPARRRRRQQAGQLGEGGGRRKISSRSPTPTPPPPPPRSPLSLPHSPLTNSPRLLLSLSLFRTVPTRRHRHRQGQRKIQVGRRGCIGR